MEKINIPQNLGMIALLKVGSHSYGLATEKSDIDLKGIYIQNKEDILYGKYTPFFQIDKDTMLFELRHFMKLLSEANPAALEMLYQNDEILGSNWWKMLKNNKEKFLTKKTYKTFARYADSQIKKATSNNKMYNWEEADTKRKTIIDFAKIFCRTTGRSHDLTKWLEENEWKQEFIGLKKLEGHRDNWVLYIDELKYVSENVRFDDIIETRNYKGFGNGNEPVTSIIEKHMLDQWKGIIYWNREAYSEHCKKYEKYQKWLNDRNPERVATNKEHNQKYDSKNIMHLYRLALIAKFIVKENTVKVDMSDFREELLNIKNGKVSLKAVIEKSEKLINDLDQEFKNSNLPDEISKDETFEIEKSIREDYYSYEDWLNVRGETLLT